MHCCSIGVQMSLLQLKLVLVCDVNKLSVLYGFCVSLVIAVCRRCHLLVLSWDVLFTYFLIFFDCLQCFLLYMYMYVLYVEVLVLKMNFW